MNYLSVEPVENYREFDKNMALDFKDDGFKLVNTDTIIFDALTRMDDADTFINTMDMPFRFFPCLAAGLAYYISIKRAPNRTQMLKAMYEEEFQRAMTEDRDRASFNVVPQYQYFRSS